MAVARYKEGTDPLMAIMNQYSFNKMKGKSLFLKNCWLLIGGIGIKEIEEIIKKSGAFKIIENDKQGKSIVINESSISSSIIKDEKDLLEEKFLGLLVAIPIRKMNSSL